MSSMGGENKYENNIAKNYHQMIVDKKKSVSLHAFLEVECDGEK